MADDREVPQSKHETFWACVMPAHRAAGALFHSPGTASHALPWFAALHYVEDSSAAAHESSRRAVALCGSGSAAASVILTTANLFACRHSNFSKLPSSF